MNRTTYIALRRAARLAARSYWKIRLDKYTNQYDRDRAYTQMMDARLAVPGGVWTPYVYPVTLDGWLDRRRRVESSIHARKTKARIAYCVNRMAQRFSA